MKRAITASIAGLIVTALACDSVGEMPQQKIELVGHRDNMTFVSLGEKSIISDDLMDRLEATRDFYRDTIGCSTILTNDMVVITFSNLPNETGGYLANSNWSTSEIDGFQLYSDEITVAHPQLMKFLQDNGILNPNSLTPIIFIRSNGNLIESAEHEFVHALCHENRRIAYEGSLYKTDSILTNETVSVKFSKDPIIYIYHENGGVTALPVLMELHAQILQLTREKQVRLGLDQNSVPELNSEDFPPILTDPYSKAYNYIITTLSTHNLYTNHTQLSSLIRDGVTRYGSESLAIIANELHTSNPHLTTMEIFDILLKALFQANGIATNAK